MNALDALVVGKARVGDAHATQGGGNGAPVDADARAAFHAVLRDVGQGKGEPKGAQDARRGADEPVADGEADASGKTGSDKKPDRGAKIEADGTAPVRDTATADISAPATLPSASDAARILAELTGARDVRTPQSSEARSDADGRGRSGTATASTDDAPEAQPKVLKATIVARETHFEPVKRPDSLDRMTAAARADDVSAPDQPADDTDEVAARVARAAALSANGALAAAPTRTDASQRPQNQAEVMAAVAQAGTGAGPRRAPSAETAPRAADDDTTIGEPDGAPTAASDPQPEAPVAAAPRAERAGGERAAAERAGDAGVRGATASETDEAAAGTTGSAEATAAGGSATETPESLPAPTLQRLAGSILTEARALASAAASSAAGAEPQQQSGGPVKILTIRLQPDELGTVTVRLRLVGNALEMQFRVSNADTAELLKRDRQALSELLKSSGYDADLLTIQTTGGDNTLRAVAVPDTSATTPQRQDWQQPDGSRQGGQPSGQQEGGDRSRQNDTPSRGTTERHDETLADSSRPGDLYV